MKKLIVFSLVLAACSPEKELNQRVINYEDEEILVGEITLEGLQQAPFREWFDYFYDETAIDSDQLDLIADHLQEAEILLFLGTWCSDSQEQVPGFIRMLRYVGFDMDHLKMVALEKKEDGRMLSPGGEEKGLDIQFVPTFIFYQEGEEIGRIVEFPDESLELDMVKILSSK